MSESKKTPVSKAKGICLCALSAAVICGCTLISIPLPIGYFNLGDAAILVCAWLLGPLLGCVAAALGSALADVLIGYIIYAPATALIKALVALCFCFLFISIKKIIKSERIGFIPFSLSSIIAEAVMVGGYFAYEAIILSFGAGAVAGLAGNVLQALCAVVIGTFAYSVLRKRGIVRRTFNITN